MKVLPKSISHKVSPLMLSFHWIMTVWLGAAAAVPKCALQLKCKLKCMPRTLGLLIDAL